MSAPSQIPAFDPDSTDAEILDAYERGREMRLVHYRNSLLGLWPDGHASEAAADAVLQADLDVEGNYATTLPGVIAQLQLATASIDQSSEIERVLVERGLLAVISRAKDLDGNARVVAMAARELLDIEWDTALADYVRSASDFAFALTLQDHVSELRRNNGGTDFAAAIERFADEAEERFTDKPQIDRLVRTLVPDHHAYERKVEIIIAEGVTDAVPWLARDTRFLLGSTHRDTVANPEA